MIRSRHFGGTHASFALLAGVSLLTFTGAVEATQQGHRRSRRPRPLPEPTVILEDVHAFGRSLRFPYGVQSFDRMDSGEDVRTLEGWTIPVLSPLTVCGADDVMGEAQVRPDSTRWLRIEDSNPRTFDVLASPVVTAPAPWNYGWKFDVNLETLPPVGAEFAPALLLEHGSEAGFVAAWGVEFDGQGAHLFVSEQGGTSDRLLLFPFSGATAPGEWFELEVSVDLTRNRLLALVNGTEAGSLPINPGGDVDLLNHRFCYRGAGQGNVMSLLLDDVTVAFRNGVCKESYSVDFESDLEHPLVNGQDISSPEEFSGIVSVSASGPNAGAAIFDSTPLGPNDPSQDVDLLIGQGNLLILQTDANTTQTVPGIFDRPNDDEDGGTLAFAFARPVQPLNIDLVDLCPDPGQVAIVTLTDESGLTRTYDVPSGWTNDLVADGVPGVQTLDLTTLADQPGVSVTATASEDAGYDDLAVVSIDVFFGGSAAVDNLEFCVECVTLDFETEDDGSTLLANGQIITTPPEFGNQVALSSNGFNGAFDNVNAGLVIFDSTPGGPNDPSQDTDLLVGLGNLLILQDENAFDIDPLDDFWTRANDDADGGTMRFDFLAPVSPRVVDMVDLETGGTQSCLVRMFDTSGRERSYFCPSGWTTDVTIMPPGFLTLDLTTLADQPGAFATATASEDVGFDPTDVIRIDFVMRGSGAVDNLCFCP